MNLCVVSRGTSAAEDATGYDFSFLCVFCVCLQQWSGGVARVYQANEAFFCAHHVGLRGVGVDKRRVFSTVGAGCRGDVHAQISELAEQE